MSGTVGATVPLRRLARCLDGQRVPISREERGTIPGNIPYWGSGGVLDTVGQALFDEPLVLLGEDGAPFFEPGRDVAFLLDGPAWVNNHIHVLRSNAAIERRFLVYALNAVDYARYITGSTRDKLTQDDMWAIRIPQLPVDRQRAIADYLDRETARIDALIAAKRRMAELLEERWQGVLETTIQALVRRFGETPLKYVCREVVVGIVITPSAWYADSGIPAIRGVNVSPGAISQDELVYLTPEGHELHLKSRLCCGDVVVVRTGQAGAAAVVPPELEGANCIDLVIIRPSPHYSPQFLEYVLNSDWMQKHVAEYSVGTIQSHFNVGAASAVPVPQAPRADQDAAVARLGVERLRVRQVLDVLHDQIGLLQERRQAFITAAVTGQLDIAEAA